MAASGQNSAAAGFDPSKQAAAGQENRAKDKADFKKCQDMAQSQG